MSLNDLLYSHLLTITKEKQDNYCDERSIFSFVFSVVYWQMNLDIPWVAPFKMHLPIPQN